MDKVVFLLDKVVLPLDEYSVNLLNQNILLEKKLVSFLDTKPNTIKIKLNERDFDEIRKNNSVN